jgi:hypothetical protein
VVGDGDIAGDIIGEVSAPGAVSTAGDSPAPVPVPPLSQAPKTTAVRPKITAEAASFSFMGFILLTITDKKAYPLLTSIKTKLILQLQSERWVFQKL